MGMADAMRGRASDPRLWFLQDKKRFAAAHSSSYYASENDFMSNKVILVNDNIVITGSYNFCDHQEANDENLPVINSSQIRADSSYFDEIFSDYQKRQKKLDLE